MNTETNTKTEGTVVRAVAEPRPDGALREALQKVPEVARCAEDF